MVGKIVMIVRVVDYDLGENGIVYYIFGNNRSVDLQTGDSLFVIDGKIGLVILNIRILDREKVDQYLLFVVVIDGGKVFLSSIVILII